jgi:CheY-like chemotaxis protein
MLVGGLLKKAEGWEVSYASNGTEALEAIRQQRPDVVVTDLQMPETDGLELVTAIRVHYSDVPVILMTAHGSETLAVEALEQGASSYVPKSQLSDKLVDTVEEVFALARADRTYERLIRCLDRTELEFSLENDAELMDPLVDLVQQIVAGMNICDPTGRYRVGVALKEALLNAMYRGNLEISFEQMQQAREELLAGSGLNIIEQRRKEAPHRDRRIEVRIHIEDDEAMFVIRDEGAGFDVRSLPTPGELGSLEPQQGRGLVLMRTFMDEVKFNDRGNEVTMIKRRETAAKGNSEPVESTV